jgi:hypothetical protein
MPRVYFHFLLVIGRWKLEDWHLFVHEQVGNVKGTVTWQAYRCLFCGTPDYKHRR